MNLFVKKNIHSVHLGQRNSWEFNINFHVKNRIESGLIKFDLFYNS